MKCVECGKEAKIVKIDFGGKDIIRCSDKKCDATYFVDTKKNDKEDKHE